MNKEDSNIDDLFDNFDSEMEEISDEESSLLTDLASIVEAPEESKEPLVQEVHKQLIPKSEEDFLKNIEEDKVEEEDAVSDETDEVEETEEDEISVYFRTVGEGLSKLGKFGAKELPTKWDQDSFLDFYEDFTEGKIQAGIEEQISDKWGDEGIKMFNDIFVTGLDPREYFGRYNQILDLDSIDMTKETNQKLIVSRYLDALGQDEEEILDQIEVLEDKGKLQERSEKYKKILVDDEKREMGRIAAEKESKVVEAKKAEQARYGAIKDVVNKAIIAKEINGIPLSIKDSKELLPFATEPAWKLPNGNLITDADKTLMEIKKDPIKWVALCKLLKEDLNVGPIKAKGVDEKADEVFKFKTKKTIKADPTRDTLDVFLKKVKF